MDEAGPLENVDRHIDNIETCTVQDWIETAADKYHMLRNDVEMVKKTIEKLSRNRYRDNDAPPDSVDPSLLSALSDEHPEFREHEWEIKARLKDHLHLAHSVTKTRRTEADFIILDDRQPGHVVAKFQWSLRFYWRNFGTNIPFESIPICARGISFRVAVSRCASYAIIVGPAEQAPDGMITTLDALPATKILYCDSWTVEPLCGLDLGWPTDVIFDTRPSREHMAYIAVSVRTHNHTFQGNLTQFDVEQRCTVVECVFPRHPVSSIQLLQEGHQLMVVQFSHDINMYLLDSSTLRMRYSFAFSSDKFNPFDFEMRAIYSDDLSYLSLIFLKELKPRDSYVETVPLVPSECRQYVPSLRKSCRAVIVKHAHLLDMLKLPKALFEYLHGQPLDCD